MTDSRGQIVSAENACPICQTQVTDAGRFVGVGDGALGDGVGGWYSKTCEVCGSELVGWQRTTDDPGHIRWEAMEFDLPESPPVSPAPAIPEARLLSQTLDYARPALPAPPTPFRHLMACVSLTAGALAAASLTISLIGSGLLHAGQPAENTMSLAVTCSLLGLPAGLISFRVAPAARWGLALSGIVLLAVILTTMRH